MTKSNAKTSTKKSQDTKPSQELPFVFPGLENLNGNFLNGNLMATYLSANQAALENSLELSREMMRFLSQRLNADAEALQALCQCKSWEDAVNLQSEFVKSAAEDYMSEMPQLTEKAAQTGAAMWSAAVDSD